MSIETKHQTYEYITIEANVKEVKVEVSRVPINFDPYDV